MMDLIAEVSEELAYYIQAKKKACLPGLGCFEAVYQSALLNPSSDILCAPAKTIVFGTAHEEDNHFQHYLTEQFPNQDVYSIFKQKVIDLLMTDMEVSLPGLGQLTVNQNGDISFEHEEKDEFNFDFEDIILTPVPTVTGMVENMASDEPQEGPGYNEKKNEEGMSFLRIAMLAVVSALCLSVYFNQATNDVVQPKPKSRLVNNVNVSPKAFHDEVYIAAESLDGVTEGLEEEEKAEIIKRQDAMTTRIVADAPIYKAEIITNTFSSRDNVDRQINLIESLGYQSARLDKGSNLISTMILLSYTEEEELASLLDKIRQDFPRAKVHK